MKNQFKSVEEFVKGLKEGKLQNKDVLAEISFDNAKDLKLSLAQLMSATQTRNPESSCNIFYHNINEQKVDDPQKTGEYILTDGLLCNYSTIFRTLTYSFHDNNNINDFAIEKMFAYSYVTGQYSSRKTLVAAIPKYLKDGKTIINFSTPDISNLKKDWTNTSYVEYDKIKTANVDPRFMFCMLDINEDENKYNLVINPHSYVLMSPKSKEKTKDEFVSQLHNLQSAQTHENSMSR